MKEFLWPVRVYYEDTDSGGVVYYANYLKFMERGRTEWLRSLGFEQDELREKEGILFAVRKVEVDYLSPARFNDALLVSVEIQSRGKASLVFRQEIRSEADGGVLCRGAVKVACLDQSGFHPVPIPTALLSVIADDV
ncbi:MAG: tol-pal system-associated acyl-CoA thioesterase [Sedimenticola sp.]|nr:tol-pal system-associated acyl-CoA thioesterase [Sedimenticola sp.]